MANLSSLASDDNNQEFTGARDPDSVLHVRFYERALENNFQTEQQGRPIFDTVIFIEIHTPGNQLNIIDRPKIKNDEFRFPRQWAFYQNTHSDDPAKQGTPLTQWPFIDIAKAEMLKAMKFFTVEQIAFASDEQITHIGMLAGMAPFSFRDRAKAYLDVAKDSSVVSKQAEALKASEARITEIQEQHKKEMAEMNDKLNAVLEKLSKPEKPKRALSEAHKAALKAGRERHQKEKGVSA